MITGRAIQLYFALTIMLVIFSFDSSQKISWPFRIEQADATYVSNMETEIFSYINLHRKSAGLKPLQLSNIESSEAAQHSSNMASGKIPFGHGGFSKRIKAIEGRLGSTTASAENVAYGQMGAKEVVDTWLHSPEHKKNIEGDYSLTGVGVAKGKKGMIYFTEIFTRQD